MCDNSHVFKKMHKYIVALKWKWTMASEKYDPIVDENHGFISPNYEKHPSDSSLSIPILNAMANYKHQYSILYQLKSSDLAKYVRRGVDVNYGYTSCIYPNHNPVYESLMLWSITVANIEHYYLRLIIHMGKQINNILWYCDNIYWEYTSLFWRKSWFYLSESWRTSIWIITILPNPYMSHAYNKHLVR